MSWGATPAGDGLISSDGLRRVLAITWRTPVCQAEVMEISSNVPQAWRPFGAFAT